MMILSEKQAKNLWCLEGQTTTLKDNVKTDEATALKNEGIIFIAKTIGFVSRQHNISQGYSEWQNECCDRKNNVNFRSFCYSKWCTMYVFSFPMVLSHSLRFLYIQTNQCFSFFTCIKLNSSPLSSKIIHFSFNKSVQQSSKPNTSTDAVHSQHCIEPHPLHDTVNSHPKTP